MSTSSADPGDRVFDVSVEGQQQLNDYDIAAETGSAATAIVETVEVTPSDGTIDVSLSTVTDNAKISAIEIVEAQPEPGVLGGPSGVDFGTVVTGESTTKTVTLSNEGESSDASSITVDGVSVTGTDADDFSTDFSGSVTLAPGETTDVTVTFAPSSAQAKSATLEVSHDAPNTGSPLTVDLSGEGSSSVAIGFGHTELSGFSAGNPSSIDWGPDGRLYVSTQGGTVYALTVQRNGPEDYEVSDTETINLVKDIPNHNDDGSFGGPDNQRQVTGLRVGGTADQPVVYVTSSDPRISVGNASPPDESLDTNSGTVSRLTQQSDGSWEHDVLVRGLPRSEENHAVNGLAIADGGDTLYVAVGGHTNQGAPGDKLSYLPEYALSAAILEVDVAQIENNNQPQNAVDENGNVYAEYYYDLPTLNPDQSNAPNGGPFGGLDGVNMAKLVQGGPVQVYSPGYRNPYDVVIRPNGDLYTIDNGHNGGWGDQPVGEGTNACTNEINDGGGGGDNPLHHIDQEGYYGGHANPTRGNPDGANVYAGGFQDNAGELLVDFSQNSPVEVSANPVECDWQAPGDDGALTTFGASTNGLGVYTADNFGGALDGALLAAQFNSNVFYVTFNGDGTEVVDKKAQFTAGVNKALDVTATGDDEPYPGTVWVADFGGNDIDVYEPDDFGDSTGGGDTCVADDPSNPDYDPDGDADGDGYTNADENDVGTDPCSSSSTPNDFDNDGVSNLNDPDDDNDGAPDTQDPFAIDPDNGTTTTAPIEYTFNAGSEPGTILELGFTGLMTNGQDNYQDLYDESNVIAGAAAPVLTIEDVPPGDAVNDNNDQQYAFQSGVQVNDQPLTVHTTLEAPFSSTPVDFQSQGLYIGNGDQDNYIKLVTSAKGGTGGIQFGKETGGTFTNLNNPDVPEVVGSKTVDLYLDVYPGNDTAVARYTISGNNIDGTITGTLGSTDIPSSWLDSPDQGMAFGVISTSFNSDSFGTDTPYTATYVQLDVTQQGQDTNQAPSASFTVSPSQPTTGEQVTFDASGSSDPDGSIDSYAWDVDGDGQAEATGQTATTTFDSAGDKTVELTVTDDAGATATATQTVNVADATTGNVLYRVNAGEAADVAATDDGPDWTGVVDASSPFLVSVDPNGGNYNNGDDVTKASDLSASVPEAIFDAERFGNMTWAFDVTAGSQVEVRLYHSNQFSGADSVGDRQFNASIEGQQVLTNYDPVADVGDDTGTVKTFTVTDDGDGTITITYTTGAAENPQVNGIEIVETGDAPSNTVPSVDTIADQTVTEGETLDVSVSASDEDSGDTPSLSLGQAPAFASFTDNGDGTGTITLAPTSGAAANSPYTVEVVADDGTTTTTESFQVTVEALTTDTYGVTTGEATNVVIDTSTATNAAGTLSGTLTLGSKSEATPYVKIWPEGQPQDNFWYSGDPLTASGEFSFDVVLSPSTTYVWQTLSQSGDGEWKAGEQKTFTTPTGEFFGVDTGDATNVGVESATLEGEIINLGDNDNAQVYFTYWKQGQKESTLTWYTGPVQDSAGAFSTEVGLEPGTTYEYRAFGQSNEGEWKAGPVTSFTTQTGQPYGVATQAPTNVGPESATLNGELTGLGDFDSATVYFQYWEQGQKSSTLNWYTGSSLSSPDSFSTDVTGLTPETTYVVQAYAQSNTGKWTAGSEQTVTTEDTAANNTPTASFTVSPSQPTTGEQVTFDASGSSDPDGSIDSYAWDVDGDGQAEATGQTATTTFDSAGEKTVELTVRDDAGATATATQTVTVSEPTDPASAAIEVTSGAGLEASTYSDGSFEVTNTGEQSITSLSIDLSSATLPDMVFDPDGTAGDQAAKGLSIDSESGGDGNVGVVSTADGDVFSQPHNGQNGSDGYDVLTIEFSDFEPGETVTFSTDNDPTTIKGATVSSQEAGPVSGLELARATVTVEYETTTQTTQTVGDGSQGGATGVADGSVPTAPTIDVQGVSLDGNVLDSRHSGTTVTSASQTITVSGPAGATVQLVQVEGELELSNVPDYDGTPGYEVENYEANKAENVGYYTATIGSDGTVDVPVTLTDSTDVGGLNYFVAHVEDGEGAGLGSNVVVLELSSDSANSAPSVASVSDTGVSETQSTTVDISTSDPDGDTPSLSLGQAPAFASLADNGDGTATVTLAPGTGTVGTYTVEVFADDGLATSTETFAVYVDEPDQDGSVEFAVNAGGPEFTAADGTTYQADTNFDSGTTFSTGEAGTPSDPDIAATTDDTLYQTERYGDPFGYDIPVSENGTYEVTLKFAEIYQGVSSNDSPDSSGPTDGTNENDRLFDAGIEGQQVLTSYDIFSEAGPLAATDKTYTVEVTDGTLNIDFTATNDNAKISAIKVEQVGSDGDGDTESSTAPSVDAVSNQTVTEGASTAVDVSASDPDGDSLTLSLSGAPTFASLTDDGDGTGTLSLSPTDGDAGTYTFDLVADDGTTTAAESITVTVETANSAPSIDTVSDQTVIRGETVTVPIGASDPDGDTLSLSKSSGPSFVTLTDNGDNTGALEVAPGSGDAGTYTIEVVADDGTATATESFQLTVDAGTATTATGDVLHRVNAGESQNLSASDGGPDWTGVTDTSSQYLASVGSDQGNFCNGDDVSPDGSVPSSTPAGVYDCEGYGAMTWTFGVNSGAEVEVRLYLSNQFSGADSVGDRQYNASIEGQQVLTNYDPVADVGDDTGTVKTFTVTDDGDGTVTVSFSQGPAENPQVNAIELVATS